MSHLVTRWVKFDLILPFVLIVIIIITALYFKKKIIIETFFVFIFRNKKKMHRPFLLTSLQILFQMIVVTICAKINHLDLISSTQIIPWRCPEIAQQPAVECSCDMPHTLRCNGDRPEAMQIIGRKLRSLPPVASVSLLDCTVQNVSALPGPLFEGVALHGLVVSSGAIKDVHKHAFMGLASPLQALGLPNNQLSTIPTAALAALPTLDRLDLSHNLLRKLDNSSFKVKSKI